MDDHDVRRIVANARPARPDRPREGYLVDFRDDNKTEVTGDRKSETGPVSPARAPRPRR